MVAFMAHGRARVRRNLAFCAASIWAASFAILHIVWALGWYVGLHQEEARKAFQRGWFLAYDLFAALLCVLASAVALALVGCGERQSPPPTLRGLAWCITAILTMRGAASVIQAVYFTAAGRNVLEVPSPWDAWFCLGAILFGAGIVNAGIAPAVECR